MNASRTQPLSRMEVNASSVPPPRGHFSHAVVAGDTIYVSGLLALGPDGSIHAPGDIVAQTTHVLDVLDKILDASGSSARHLVKLTTYVTDIADRAAVSAARVERWPDVRPASTLVEVSDLAGDGAVIELDAVALRSDS